jgi:hypothetical protein
MNLRRVVCSAALMALAAGTAAAQDKGQEKEKTGTPAAARKAPADPQEIVAAYEKAAAPVEQHKLLQKMVGKWNVSMKSWMDPKAPPLETTGTAEGKSLFGDRYTQLTVASTFMGKPFNGIGTSGYDKARKKFVGTWIDSMSTGFMRSEGTADPAGKTVTSQGVASDPLTGKDSKMRIVDNYESADKVVQEFFEKRGGKELKVMEITYTRAK